MRAELLDLLTVRRGHFLLESGHHGDLWLDLDHLFVRAVKVREFAAELACQLVPHRVDAVVGPMTGGAFLAQLLAVELDARCFYTERLVTGDGTTETAAYRVPDALRADLHGQRVAVVDDVMNAGSAVRKTLADVQDCGAEPVALGALLVLGQAGDQLAAEHALPLERLAAEPAAGLWAPHACPHCAAGEPMEDLVPR